MEDYPQNTHSEDIPKDLIIETRSPSPEPLGKESLEFHAARLLFLLKYAGGRKKKIVGRTKIAKLDFFVRYPTYLAKAAELREVESMPERHTRPESPMIRYRYGPWDSKYYNVFALLVAKGFVSIFPSNRGDVFLLTEKGEAAVEDLEGPEFNEVVERCSLVNKVFKGMSGTKIKNFIYENFPEVVAKPIGKEISP